MILGFSTQLNGKPTYFVEKILRGIINEHSHKGLGLADYIYQSGEALKYQNVDDIFQLSKVKLNPNSTPSEKTKMTDGNQEQKLISLSMFVLKKCFDLRQKFPL